jgi:hypothetical protein
LLSGCQWTVIAEKWLEQGYLSRWRRHQLASVDVYRAGPASARGASHHATAGGETAQIRRHTSFAILKFVRECVDFRSCGGSGWEGAGGVRCRRECVVLGERVEEGLGTERGLTGCLQGFAFSPAKPPANQLRRATTLCSSRGQRSIAHVDSVTWSLVHATIICLVICLGAEIAMLRLPQQQLEAGDSAKNARDACYTVGQPHPTGTSTCIEEWPLVDCSFFALQLSLRPPRHNSHDARARGHQRTWLQDHVKKRGAGRQSRSFGNS